MIIDCFPSKDPGKRMLYRHGSAPKNADAFDLHALLGMNQSESEPAPDKSATLEQAREKARQKTTAEAHKRLKEADEQVRAEVNKALKEEEAQKTIEGMAENMGGYVSGGWREWNKRFGERIGLTNPIEIQNRVRVYQRVLFDELGLRGKDPSAIVDGKIGPYTLAAMAAYTKKQLPEGAVPSPENNKALVAYLEEHKPESAEGREKVEEQVKRAGEGILKDAKKVEDGLYLVEGADKKTYFKFENGRWFWASAEQKEKNEWKEVGTDYHTKGGAVSNEISYQLARQQHLQRVGENMLNGAELQPDGTYLLDTDGQKTYFKYENGKWLWTSDGNKKEWMPVGEKKYGTEAMQEVDKLADELAREMAKSEVQQERLELSRKRAAIERAKKDGDFDPENSYLVKKGSAYEVVTWKPLKVNESMVVQNHSMTINTMRPGMTIVLDIDGEKVRITKPREGVYTFEGSDKVADNSDVYRMVAEIAREQREGKKVEGEKVSEVPVLAHETHVESMEEFRRMAPVLDPKYHWRLVPDPNGGYTVEASEEEFAPPTAAEWKAAGPAEPAPLIPEDASQEQREALSFLNWSPETEAQNAEAVAEATGEYPIYGPPLPEDYEYPAAVPESDDEAASGLPMCYYTTADHSEEYAAEGAVCRGFDQRLYRRMGTDRYTGLPYWRNVRLTSTGAAEPIGLTSFVEAGDPSEDMESGKGDLYSAYSSSENKEPENT